MTRREIIDVYRRMKTDDEVKFRRWITANSVIASMFAAALVAIIVASPSGTSPSTIQKAHAGQVLATAR